VQQARCTLSVQRELQVLALPRLLVKTDSFLFFQSQDFINMKKESFSGEVIDSVIFPFYLLLHKLHKTTHPSAHS